MAGKIPFAAGIFFVFVFVMPCISVGQTPNEKIVANKIFNFQFHYTYGFPGGDLANRFGTIHNIGGGGLLKLKSNWLLGLDVSYQFGTEVSEDISRGILGNIGNSTGSVLNTAGNPEIISIGERGLNGFVKAGKVIPIGSGNPNSGIVFMCGFGYVSTKVNINTPNSSIPTLTEDLKKGYDRLSMGWAATQFVGYYFQSKDRKINFYLGFDIIEASTKNVRGYNYDQRAADDGVHTDLLYGPRIGWMIPIYLTTKDQEEFFYK